MGLELLRRRLFLTLGAVTTVAVVATACKTAANRGQVKADDAEPQAQDEAGTIPNATDAFESLAFDVNDVSILFPKANGHFYPDIRFDATGKFNGRMLWPASTAFGNMIKFAGNEAGLVQADEGDETHAVFAADANAEEIDDKGQGPMADVNAGGLQLAGTSLTPKHIGTTKGNGTPDTGALINFKGREDIKNITSWRVVSMRVDFCASPLGAACEVEFRLIAQPVNAAGNTFDFAAHLLYRQGQLDRTNVQYINPVHTATVKLPPVRELIKDLQQLKSLSIAAKATTSGKPLGVHPGLAAEAAANRGAVGDQIVKMIGKYTAAGLTTVTSMELGGPAAPATAGAAKPWTFFVGDFDTDTVGTLKNQIWRPTTITGGSQQFSVRGNGAVADTDADNAVGFLPRPDNSCKATMSDLYIKPKDLKTKLTPALAKAAFFMDNPGTYGKPGSGSGGGNHTGPITTMKISVQSTDCMSCHTTATRAQALGLKAVNNLPDLYVPADGITGYPAENTVPRTDYDFRNFGYHLNFKTQVDEPRIMTRTVNESAELARFLNQDVLPKMHGNVAFGPPGRFCFNGHTPTNHAKIWDCYVTDRASTKSFDTCFAEVCGKPIANPSP